VALAFVQLVTFVVAQVSLEVKTDQDSSSLRQDLDHQVYHPRVILKSYSGQIHQVRPLTSSFQQVLVASPKAFKVPIRVD
jgi:hypothetical protein